jgi:transcriptional regulator with XRE-family HTH domain
MSAPAPAYPQQQVRQVPLIAHHGDWLDPEVRQAYMEATVEQDIAWQISINRKARGMTQAQLAAACGTRQSSIARAEDTTYGRHSIAMLVRIANAFDCALRVSLIPYSTLAEEVENTSEEALTVKAFADEAFLITSQMTVQS